MAKVFISYSSADIVWTQEIHSWLKEDGHEVFFDQDAHDGIPAGDDLGSGASTNACDGQM